MRVQTFLWLTAAIIPADYFVEYLRQSVRRHVTGKAMLQTVYSAPNISLVSIVRSVLEGCSIRCWLKNEYLSAGVGDLPPIECWPQLCVEDADFEDAKRIVEEAVANREMTTWRCVSCGESIEGQFTECWKCGQSR